jgi:hypothetical protein
MELIERRAPWIAVSAAILISFESTTIAFVFGGDASTWELVVYVGGLVCIGGTALLLAASLVPSSIRALEPDDRERLLFIAVVLVALSILAIVGLASHAAIEAYRHPNVTG